jgi:hypothetical protein
VYIFSGIWSFGFLRFFPQCTLLFLTTELPKGFLDIFPATSLDMTIISSIQDGVVCVSCQLIVGKLVRKNRPTQVTGFVVDLAGKCTEGLQMNWLKYLVNQLELDYREAQDQGYEFHFSWLLILITFIAWDMPEGATFLDIEPFEPLAMKFSTLWYSSDMNKKWQSNSMFHTYYNQLKIDIQSKPRMTSNTIHRFRPWMKFSVDRHFIYIIA